MSMCRRLAFVVVLLAALLVPAAAQAAVRDANRNRIPDRWERGYDLSTKRDLSRRDTDRDGLSNRAEYRRGTHPRRRDTDRDGLVDGRDPEPRTPARPHVATGGGTLIAPVGTPPLSDADAAAKVRRSIFEPRPLNATATRTVPTAAQLERFQAHSNDWGSCTPMRHRITGDFRGTTDEVLQWAAAKWSLDPDLLRAVAQVESYWRWTTVGDEGQSFGLMQIKASTNGGTFPLSRDSVPFNVDYHAATLRYYFDGCATWLRSEGYRSGDQWRSVGAWFSGDWRDSGSREYVEKVRAAMAERRWLTQDF